MPPRPRRILRSSSASNSPKAGVAAAADWIEDNLGSPVVKEVFNGGSGWSSSYVYSTADGRRFFVKTSLGRDEAMFKGEALGLQAMYDTHTLRIPRVFHHGPLSGPGRAGSFIVMEYLDLGGGSASDAELGRQLALMHLSTPKDEHAAAGQFGFPVDNTIGGTPQPNGWCDDWVEFYRERRLKHMLKLAGDSRLNKMADKLLPNLNQFFEGVTVKPSVLHGDLWSGNIGSADGKPTVFDPAVYYGHHEAEFGMSWCAGFSQEFWAAYNAVIPPAPGAATRRDLYQLYHYLNHLVLFGDGYYSSCQRAMERLIAALK